MVSKHKIGKNSSPTDDMYNVHNSEQIESTYLGPHSEIHEVGLSSKVVVFKKSVPNTSPHR